MTPEKLAQARTNLRLDVLERLVLKQAVLQVVSAGIALDQAVETVGRSLLVDDATILGAGKGFPPAYIALVDQELHEYADRLKSLLSDIHKELRAAEARHEKRGP
jgi:hypothetical protein